MPPNDATARRASMQRRATKACSSCRSRKVRCDVIQSGTPCSNCKVDGFDCSILARKQRTKRRCSETGGQVDAAGPREAARAAARGHLDQHVSQHQIPHYPLLRGLSQKPSRIPEVTGDSEGNQKSYTSISQDATAKAIEISLPRTSIQYLVSQGALELPARRLLDSLVTNYFEIFHPFFPVVHKADFLARYDRMHSQANDGPSLLLLQAIIFTSVASIDWSTIQELGFQTRLQARNMFHSRARNLYEFDWESDSIIVSQALLLMSHHYPSMTDQKHTWFWAQQAIGFAQGAGLHRDPGSGPQRSHWARIWWTCLSRDRLIAIGTGRPMHINSLDCNIPMLTLSDLEEPGDSDQDRDIKVIFIELIKLCQYMEGVLSLHSSDATSTEALLEQVDICDDTLQRWQSHLPNIAKSDAPSHKQDIVSMYRSVLHMIFNITVIALNQFRQGSMGESGLRAPTLKVRIAAGNIRKLAANLMQWDMVKLCPTICVTSILSSLIVHLLVQKFERNDVLLQVSSFETCMQFILQLSDTYWHAGFYHELFKLTSDDSGNQKLREEDKNSLFGLLNGGNSARAAQRPSAINSREGSDTPRHENTDSAIEALTSEEAGLDPILGSDAAFFEGWLQECGYYYNSLPSA